MRVFGAVAGMLFIALDQSAQEPGRVGDVAPSLFPVGSPDHEALGIALHRIAGEHPDWVRVEFGGWLLDVRLNR